MSVAVAEMFVQSVSPRKDMAGDQELCDLDITVTQASCATGALYEQLSASWNGPIDEFTYVILNADDETSCHDGAIVLGTLVAAIGIGPNRERSILSCGAQVSAAE